MILSLFMVPEILTFINRPSLTRWFWLNQWPNRYHFCTPGKSEAHISWLWKQNRISMTRLGFLRCQRKVAIEIQNWKIPKKNWTYFTTHIWLKTTSITPWNVDKGFNNRDLVQLRKNNFFPAILRLRHFRLSGIIYIKASKGLCWSSLQITSTLPRKLLWNNNIVSQSN